MLLVKNRKVTPTPTPIDTKRQAFEYQEKGLEFLKDKKRVALFWEMRLGKSLVTLRWLHANNVKRALIVCPLSVISSWENECKLEQQTLAILRSSDKRNGMLNLFSNQFMLNLPLYAVTNYEAILSTDIGNLKKYNWQAIILDESTTIRRPQARISQIATKIWQDAEYKAVLTGTPVPESIIDVFQQCQFLHNSFMNCDNYWKFKARYFFDIGGGKCRTTTNGLKEIRAALEPFSMVLTRKEVGIQCEKLYSKREVDFDKEYRKQYDTVEQTFGLTIDSSNTNPSANAATQTQFAIVAQSWLHQMAGGFPKIFPISRHKIDYLHQLIKDEEREENEKLVIWCQFTKEIETIYDELNKEYPNQVGKISGKVELSDRTDTIRDFQSPSGKIKYLICQLRTARMGLDFSAADTAIYFSNSWHRLDRLQSEDRVIHPQKTKPVYIIDLVTKNSIDEDLLISMQEKKRSTDELLQGAFRNFLKRHGITNGSV